MSFVWRYAQINTRTEGCCAASIVIYQQRKKTVQKTILNDVYDLLKSKQLVSSESEFSRDWLGRSECYLRTLRFQGTKPSVGCVAICASKLQHYGRRLTETAAHEHMGKRFLELSDACHAYINKQCTLTWWNKIWNGFYREKNLLRSWKLGSTYRFGVVI